MGKFVIAIRGNDDDWKYYGYSYDDQGCQIPALVNEERAMTFETVEIAQLWCTGAEKYVQYEINKLCDIKTLCIKERTIHYEYKTVAFA